MNAPVASKIEQIIASLDPDVLAAQADVDLTLVEAALSKSPEERLDSAYRVLRDLVKIREGHASSPSR